MAMVNAGAHADRHLGGSLVGRRRRLSAAPPTGPASSAEEEPWKDEWHLRYALDWFNYHASQRIQTFNFFLVVESALVVVYATLYDHLGAAQQSLIAFLAAAIVAPFYWLEVRNTELALKTDGP